ncbi:hypothetical protein C8Q76DRAFT_179761 [Earliella scabrosa]|nr:hypothetical protein C8Q76DRAFT_179761 [Earliella scabrosa]
MAVVAPEDSSKVVDASMVATSSSSGGTSIHPSQPLRAPGRFRRIGFECTLRDRDRREECALRDLDPRLDKECMLPDRERTREWPAADLDLDRVYERYDAMDTERDRDLASSLGGGRTNQKDAGLLDESGDGTGSSD